MRSDSCQEKISDYETSAASSSPHNQPSPYPIAMRLVPLLSTLSTLALGVSGAQPNIIFILTDVRSLEALQYLHTLAGRRDPFFPF
jgi:hypothetical protein